MSDNTFLDVDDEILAKNLLLPENGDRACIDVTRLFDSKPFVIIQPSPGACIKTKTNNEEKIFINICTTDKIPAPEDISDAKLFEILSEEAPSFAIPMSIGSERLETDKSGSPWPTYDVAINTSYFEKCQKKTSFWLFTISVIMDGVSNKFSKFLNTEDYVILKNRKAMGKLQKHRIENREPRHRPQLRKPLIEEISSSRRDNQAKPSQQAFQNSELKYVLCRQPAEGPVTRLIGLFDMPKGITSKNVVVHIDTDRVVVTIDNVGFTYDIFLPYTVQVKNTKCFLDTDMKVLRLNMPVEEVSGDIQD